MFFFFCKDFFFNYLFRKYNFFIILHATRKIIHEKAHNLTWSMTFSFFFFGSFMAMRIFFGSFILIENLLFFKSIFFYVIKYKWTYNPIDRFRLQSS